MAQLYIETREDVYRYLLTLGIHPPKAQEAVQEVFLRLYTSLKKGEKIESMRGWVFRVAHNYGLKVRARQSSEEIFDPAFEARMVSPGPDAERDLLEREKMTRLNSAVGDLSEQQRRVLFLRMEGLRYPEIGAAMGISASAVGEFLRRALLRLKKVRDE
ncbi:MAG: sigma-70 family RNA polymerase sigma factor [Ignavibacteriota bacterium]